ncbi:DEAD/DEAH box helicase family protein [Virgibacillus sp. NKC19-3]|uniref:DEAD/DEAH box helicase n=1 Tax=Virgibacillus saliphilus TaxID=2831674 RepID=UPI001C9AE09B|nr:SNF2-related protein [Virgibacillus sp. NKC19-3]MBY7143065.1 DEAD/DEAH box helicase family protein [Virgibacillus sp. NKC19-3]
MINNKKDVKRLESEVNHILENCNLFSEEHFNNQIKDAWQTLKRIKVRENVKTIPIDTISTLEKGLPVNVLVENGFRSLYDIRDQSAADLMYIDGIGEKYADSIAEAVSKITESVYQQAKPRIDPDDLSGAEIDLLESIYRKWELLPTLESLHTDADYLHQTIIPDMETAKNKKGFVGSLFQSKTEKEQIKAAFDRLNAYQENLESIYQKLDKIIPYTVDRDALIQHFVKENAAYYTEIEKVTDFEQTEEAEDLPAGIVETIRNTTLDTTGLKIALRQYQTFGAKYALYYRRTLLGDEMGLGKTIQALAMVNHLSQRNQKYALVVCPLSVLANWKREIEQHSELKTFIFHGRNRDAEFAKWQAQTGVILTTYEHTLHMNLEEEQPVDALIVDEAHYVKNPEAKRSQRIYQLAANVEYVLFMSGTPLENRLDEMKQLMSVLQPDIAEKLSEKLHLLMPNEFRQLVAPVYLRRNRKDVLAELPELEIIPQWTNFGEEEEEHYQQAVMAGQLMLMRRAAWLGGTPGKSPKLEKLLDICQEAYENGQKVLVFSFFRDVIDTIQRHVNDRTFEAITGDVSNARRQEIIDAFTDARPGSVLVSQISAGGVGLNIQAANIVVLCEPQWKPSTEEQAISRAYRMGQSRNVIVYRLLTEESIDGTMLEILGEKANLFDLYARESDVASLALQEHEESEEESIKKKVLKLEQERLEQYVG